MIGCGAVGQIHLRGLRRLRGVEIAAVCDVDKRSATETARRFGIPHFYTEPAELLARERPDAVHVLTPPATHRELTVEALRGDAHVLVEKPMALDTSEADEMIDAARHHGRSLGVCHNFLFDPPVVRALRLAESGRLGRILSVDIYWSAYRYGRPDRYSHTDWIPQLPGGALHELAPHVVYLLQAFLGRLEILQGAVRSFPNLPPPCEEAHVLFTGSSAFGSALLSLSSRPYELVVRIHGTEASVLADVVRSVAIANGHRLWHRRRLGRAQPNPGHNALLARFYESLSDGGRPPVTGEHGRDVVAVLDRLWSTIQRVDPER